MSAATIFHALAYTPMPDWLFYPLAALPAAFVCVVVADWLLELWRERK